MLFSKNDAKIVIFYGNTKINYLKVFKIRYFFEIRFIMSRSPKGVNSVILRFASAILAELH